MSLRARLLVIGVTGVALALALGGVAFYGALTYAVNRTLDNEALGSAREVAALVEADRLPAPVPVSGAQVVQVVDAEQRVVGGSATADRLVPMLAADELERALAGQPVVIDGARLGLSGPLRVRAVTAGPAGSRVSVVSALPVGDVLASRAALRNALLLTFPVLLIGLAAIAWRVIGRTLRPVEELRVGAERISGAARDERLPLPVAADEIRALAVTLNTMLDRLAATRARQRSFVADAAHELRSPLASLRTQLEVAERLGEGGDLPADLLVDVERLSVLVEGLLLLARADAGAPGPTHPTRVDVAGLLAEVAGEHAEDRVPVRVGEAAGPVWVRADREELRRAVDNLVANAVRHAASAVELSVTTAAGRVRLGVSDDGPGVAGADRERVFERFTRLDDARARDSGGFGLGLAIVRELTLRAGGEVELLDGGPGWSLKAEIRLPEVTAGAGPRPPQR